MSPADLAAYDIVLTDYRVLQSELYFIADNRRDRTTLRQRSGASISRISPVTPLTQVNWWRVCLDEAQMIDTPINQSSKMVKLLPGMCSLKNYLRYL